MLDSATCRLHLLFTSGFRGKLGKRREGSTSLNSPAVMDTASTVGCCDAVAAAHNPPYCGAGRRSGLPSRAFSFPASKQHWQVMSRTGSPLQLHRAASNAAAPRQRNAELLGTESAERSRRCSLRSLERTPVFLLAIAGTDIRIFLLS